MNYLETLLIQAKAECKNIRSEAYHEGFKDAEGTANTMQKEFNAVQKLLLSVLGRERGCTETTLDTAQRVVDEFVKLKNNPSEYLKGYHEGYQAGEEFYTRANPVLPTGCEMPKAANSESLGQKIERLIAYLEKHSRENNNRAEMNEFKELMLAPITLTDFTRLVDSEPMIGECQEVNCEECKAPAQRWIIECKSPSNTSDSWKKSRDTGVCGTFPSKAEAELAISNDGPAQYGSILRRVTRID
jgi:hypothetical protein